MEYVYGALLLHAAGKDINEENLKKVMTAAGSKAEDAMVKAVVASLDGVNIEEAVKSAAPIAAAPVAAVPGGDDAAAPAKEENAEDEKKSEEEAASGLASLFG